MNEFDENTMSFGKFMNKWQPEAHRMNLFAVASENSTPKPLWVEMRYLTLLYKEQDNKLHHKFMFELTPKGVAQYKNYTDWLLL